MILISASNLLCVCINNTRSNIKAVYNSTNNAHDVLNIVYYYSALNVFIGR